jgi:hypothetical protein
MLIATATVLHRVFTFDKSLVVAVNFGLVTVALMAGFITWHVTADETLMHPIVFGNTVPSLVSMSAMLCVSCRLILRIRDYDRGDRQQDKTYYYGQGSRYSIEEAVADTSKMGNESDLCIPGISQNKG